MILYLNGQDIRRLVLGIINVGADPGIGPAVFECDPDEYLAVIAKYLQSLGKSINDLEGLAVVVGPGSPTALRSSLAIAGTLALARQIPTYSIEKDPAVDDSVFVKTLDLDTLQASVGPLKPIYLRPPNITFPNNS
jgi:hypothetical protein